MDETDVRFAPRHQPPYYAAIISHTAPLDPRAAETVAARLFRLAARHPDFIGAEMSETPGHFALVTVYWTDRESLIAWIETTRALLLDRLLPNTDPGILSDFRLRLARIEAELGPEDL